MRILFVAKHDSGDNDDEGSVAHALEVLGHTVVKFHELKRHRVGPGLKELFGVGAPSFDFCLFFKWENYGEIASVAKVCPIVFWYFDMIANDDDPTLTHRMRFRRVWFNEVMRYCRTGFLTDGDWVDRWNEGEGRATGKKAHWLMQGMDERVAGFGTAIGPGPEILFTGMVDHGRKRREHVDQLKARYGDRFHVLGDSGPRFRVHGRALADLFAGTKVVVSPDGPCTDRYWSNRVYNTLGLGGFLLHPMCRGLTEQYYPTRDLIYYDSREELNDLIDHYLEMPNHSTLMREAGYKATVERNLYRHRVEELVRIVKESI